jgi:general secretion pathway protein E
MMTNPPSQSFLGNLLFEKKMISSEDLLKAKALQGQLGGGIGGVLIRLGAISEESLLQVLSDILHIQILDPANLPGQADSYIDVIKRSGIEIGWWLDQEVLAWEDPSGDICFITNDPLNSSVFETIQKVFDLGKITPFLARRYDLDRAIDLVVSGGIRQGDKNIDQLRELAEEAPVIEFVSNLLSQALEQRASDVHIEPGEHTMEVRFRIDGVLYTRFELSQERFPAIASRIKLISGIDIAERRLPQDGRVGMRMSGTDVDLRVSTVPGVYGESIVLRLLPKEQKGFSLDTLGLSDDHKSEFTQLINEPHGIILVTGPTGSGKSTTLYTAIESINDRKKKIITVEDPVEFYLQGITQIQTHADIGYTFACALRSIMRQDPDVIMIGEIRDKETADIAVQAALTGHLVVSTLHTNNSISSFIRLIDMGVDPFLVATPVKAVMAQRLVRKLCRECAEPFEPVKGIQEIVSLAAPEYLKGKGGMWKRAVGCSGCRGTGYKGRVGIYELVKVTKEIQQLILKGGSESDMWELARQQHCRTLREDGFLKAWLGITSVEEVLRVTSV